jgi:hypothetical protein
LCDLAIEFGVSHETIWTIVRRSFGGGVRAAGPFGCAAIDRSHPPEDERMAPFFTTGKTGNAGKGWRTIRGRDTESPAIW